MQIEVVINRQALEPLVVFPTFCEQVEAYKDTKLTSNAVFSTGI
jgi:hypothetical protein